MAPKPLPHLSTVEKVHMYCQLGLPALVGFLITGEVQPRTDVHWRLVTLITYGLGLLATGIPVFGAFTRGDDHDKASWPPGFTGTWQRLLVAHMVVMGVLGSAVGGAVMALRAELVSFEGLKLVGGLVVLCGLSVSIALRGSFKRKLRADPTPT